MMPLTSTALTAVRQPQAMALSESDTLECGIRCIGKMSSNNKQAQQPLSCSMCLLLNLVSGGEEEIAFSALTLLVGVRKGIRTVKLSDEVLAWLSSGAKCK